MRASSDTVTAERASDPALPHLSYALAIDFANSAGPVSGPPGDLFRDADGLARWLRHESHAVGDLHDVGGDPKRLRDFRSAVDAVLRTAARDELMPEAAVAAINRASRRAPFHAELAIGAGSAEALEVSGARNATGELLARVARSCIALVGGTERWRLRTCAAPGCGLLFEATRRQQAWCSAACGNRARVARHYHRRRAG